MWLMIAILNANKVNSCKSIKKLLNIKKKTNNALWARYKFRRLGEECTSPRHSVRQYVCFHQHLSLEENKICPSPMTTGVPVVWFESITLLILWRLWTNSREEAWRIVLLHTPYVHFNIIFIYLYIYFLLSSLLENLRLGRAYTRWTESMPGIWSRNFSSWLHWKARASFIISEGQLGHVATCIALAGSLHCFTEQEIPHLTNAHWITPW